MTMKQLYLDTRKHVVVYIRQELCALRSKVKKDILLWPKE